MLSATGANLTHCVSPNTIFHGCQIIYWDARNEKKKTFDRKDKLTCTMEKCTVSMATVNVILQDGGIQTKLINVSTVTYPRLLTMVSF